MSKVEVERTSQIPDDGSVERDTGDEKGDKTVTAQASTEEAAAGASDSGVKDQEDECARLQAQVAEGLKREQALFKEKDALQTAFNKCNLAKSKLESLCRELQRHCKAIKDECLQRNKEEEERRQEVALKFQTTVADITVKLQEHHKRNQLLKAENIELVSRLKTIVEQFERREEQLEKIIKQKQLEVQLSEAKLAQQTMYAAEEKERSLAEKQMLLSESAEQQRKCEALTQQEVELRGQLSLYTEKFEEFQKTLTKSNEVFATFKKEMDKMTKTIRKLEKETTMWRTRWENSNRSLLEMVQERAQREKVMQSIQTKNERLERLCRALQTERTELDHQLKALWASNLATESGEVSNSSPVPLGISDAAFHSIDELPPPDSAARVPAENASTDVTATEDSPSNDAGGGYLAALSHSLATASNVLEEANRMARAIQPLATREENGLLLDNVDEGLARSDGDGSLQSPSSPAAPETFDLVSSVDNSGYEAKAWDSSTLSG